MTFQYVSPTEEQKALMQIYRDKFESLSKEIVESVPFSRGRSTCLTKLEEASFWLNKAITRNDNHPVDTMGVMGTSIPMQSFSKAN